MVLILKRKKKLSIIIKSKHTRSEIEMDPLDYWLNSKALYPLLSPVACDIVTVPASTAPVERVFSCSGEAVKGRETLLRKNKQYIK